MPLFPSVELASGRRLARRIELPRHHLVAKEDERADRVLESGQLEATMAAKRKGKASSTNTAVVAYGGPIVPGTRPVPAKSRQKARARFKNFSLSRFSRSAPPENFVKAKSLKDPVAVRTLNRTIMTKNLAKWPAQDQPNAGMTLALGDAELQALMPSYKAKAGTVDLSDLLAALKPRLTGTEFYTNGGPALTQSTKQAGLRATAQQIIQSIKGGAAHAAGGGARQAKPKKSSTTRNGRTGK